MKQSQIDFVRKYISQKGNVTPSNFNGKIRMDDGRLISFSSFERHLRTLRKEGNIGTIRNKNRTVTFFWTGGEILKKIFDKKHIDRLIKETSPKKTFFQKLFK